ncbi:hypothetical protein [Knoellia sp. Soil729]|uniref:hypothetical protein n=1 Tax=Knoellia sp. Soil729 TaxID=1736394 RepID=UPI0006F6A544|nr:hypothetical protein [Knoellia sp. Soil729]KRE42403.1 hypothetical protein ASG74_08195 [Knoellia sp. Soil729]
MTDDSHTFAARAILWLAAGYGFLGAILSVYAADVTGRTSMLRVGAGLVILTAVAVSGLFVTRPRH